ncbi:MAG: histidine phosphatase family protein [Desulfobacter sp.]|nr:MAG: histidine phosphatase family protein [Desulfobacter sp.]
MPGSNRLQADLSGKFSDKGPLLFLLRHGKIRGGTVRRFIGRTDLPLDGAGRAQARAWQAEFSGIKFKKVYTSALTRCRETAATSCPGSVPAVDTRLNEIDLGDWDGQSFDRIKSGHPALFEQRGREIYNFRPPGGESFKDLFDRVSPFFNQLPITSHTLVVTHAGVIRAMRCFWAGESMEKLLTFKTGYSQLFVLAGSG